MKRSSSDTGKPVILLVFANDRNDRSQYLRNLNNEREQLEEALKPLEALGLIEIVVLHNATIKTLLDSLRDHGEHLAMMHYGGHATSFTLLLEDEEGQPAEAGGEGLAAILGALAELKLVFLNGCLTEQHMEYLLEAGIPAVVGTTAEVDDKAAEIFAVEFYRRMAEGAGIAAAFQGAAGAEKMRLVTPRRAYHPYRGYRVSGDGQISQQAPSIWPWSLRLRPGAEKVANWNIPDAAGDFLFGLPAPAQKQRPPNPYHQALAWYGANEAEIFFGRDRQIRELYQRLMSKEAAPVVLLYGQSGVGKSSLLEAGLLPRLEQKCTVRQRRRQRETDASATLRQALAAPENASGREIATAWCACEEVQGKPCIVLLDQLEEIFTRPLADPAAELNTLAQTVAEVFNDARLRPAGKLLLSFRKEYWPEIDEALAANKVNRSYVFLERLDAAAIAQIVQGPCRSDRLKDHYNLTLDEGLADQIASDLTEDPASPVATVLQILLSAMWEHAHNVSPANPHLSLTLYEKLRRSSIHLSDFLAQRRAAFASEQPFAEAEQSGLLLDVLWYCTSEQGTAEQRSDEEFHLRYDNPSKIDAVLQRAKDVRLLADATGDTPAAVQPGGARLAHDTLAPLVREEFFRSLLPGQRAHRILQSRLRDWQAEESTQQPASLSEQDLATVESGLHGMRLPTMEEETLIAASKRQRTKDQRRRRAWRIAGVVTAALVLVLAAAASWFSWVAQNNEAEARRQESIAHTNAARWESASATNAAQLLQSQSREVAAVAENQLNDGAAETALLLSLQAFTGITKTAQAETVLRQSLNQWNDLQTLTGHSGTISNLFFSPDGRYLASASSDDTARLWDLGTGQEVFTITQHAGDVTSAIISSDSGYLVTSSRDGTARIWSVPDGKLIQTITVSGIVDGIRSLALHPNGRWVGLRAGAEIWLYDIASGKPVGQSPYHVDDSSEPVALRSLAFMADGSQILAGGDDTRPHIWNIDSGQHAGLGAPAEGISGHQGSVLSFQQTQDTRFFVSLSADRLILREREPATGNLLYRPLAGADNVRYTNQFLFSPDSHYLVAPTEGGGLRIWDLNNLTALPLQISETVGSIGGIRFSPDGRLLAYVSSDGSVQLYDMVSQVNTAVARMTGSSQSSPVFSRDGGVLAAADATGTIHLWRVWPGGEQPALPLRSFAANAAALVDSQLVVAGNDGIIEFRNRADFTLRIQNVNDAYFTAAAASDDGKVLAVGDNEGIVVILDPKTSRLLHYWNTKQERIEDLLFLPNSTLLAVGGASPALQLWDWRNEELAATPSSLTHGVTALAYDPVYDRLYAADRAGAIHRWQASDMTELPALTAGAPLLGLAVSLDGAQLVASTSDARLLVWAEDGVSAPRQVAAGSPIRSLAYTEDGRLLAGTESGELQIWDLASRSLVAIKAHPGRWIKDIEVDREQRRAITIGDDGWIKQWLLDDHALIRLACSRLDRRLDLETWDQLFDFRPSDVDPCAGNQRLADATALISTEQITETDNGKPVVLFFESTQDSQAARDSRILLRWSVIHATQITLEYPGGSEPLTGSGEKRLPVSEESEVVNFRLIARNPNGVRILNLNVVPLPP